MDPLNPIFAFAAKGQFYEKEKEWSKSVHWYHRALACLPNLYGIDKKIWQFPSMKAKPVSFTPKHASRIYTALGRSLLALGRRQDGWMAFRSAYCLDTENISAQRMMLANPGISKSRTSEADIDVVENRMRPPASTMDLKTSLTLIMVTHCTSRLKKFAALSPPSSKLLTATYGSLLNILGEDICEGPKFLCYDYNPAGSMRDARYGQAVALFSRQHGFQLCTYPGIGLFSILNRTIPTVNTPYILFVEHDWMFQGSPIQLKDIIEMMNNEPNIHSIRFNKRSNHIDGLDFIMNVDTSQQKYPLLQNSSYSNNPSIIRTDKLKKEWLPACEQALHRVSDKLGGSAFGIEEILFKRQVADIREEGFDAAHKVWGTHVFGRVGDPPRVVHLGE